MSESKYTPGPWSVSFESVDPEWAIVATQGGRVVANVNADHLQDANARLIAAAPDLLQAGKPFAAVADEFERKMHDAGFTTRDSDEIGPDWIRGFTFGDLRALRDAIAKAEGQRAYIDEIPADHPTVDPIVPVCDFLCDVAAVGLRSEHKDHVNAD